VRDQVSDQVSEVLNWRWWYGFGQFESFWCSYYEVMHRMGVIADLKKLEPMVDLAKSAGWTVCFWDWVFVSKRPSAPVQRDDQNRLHCLNGPAIGYEDGFGVYAVHGVRVPRYVILEPTSITLDGIRAEQNAEVRRVMIDRYGPSRYLIDSGATLIDSSLDGLGNLRQLYRQEVPGDEPIVMVRVVNSTQEPDGTFKTYWLRVAPDLRPMASSGKLGEPQELTALNAVASTFGMRGEEYEPAVET